MKIEAGKRYKRTHNGTGVVVVSHDEKFVNIRDLGAETTHWVLKKNFTPKNFKEDVLKLSQD